MKIYKLLPSLLVVIFLLLSAFTIVYYFSVPFQKKTELFGPLRQARTPSPSESAFPFNQEAFFYAYQSNENVNLKKGSKLASLQTAVLKGTVILSSKEQSLAFVEDPTMRETKTLKIGDVFMESVVKNITSDTIVFLRNQEEITLGVFKELLPDESKVIENSLSSTNSIIDKHSQDTNELNTLERERTIEEGLMPHGKQGSKRELPKKSSSSKQKKHGDNKAEDLKNQ
jgi:hypothetical protein